MVIAWRSDTLTKPASNHISVKPRADLSDCWLVRIIMDNKMAASVLTWEPLLMCYIWTTAWCLYLVTSEPQVNVFTSSRLNHRLMSLPRHACTTAKFLTSSRLNPNYLMALLRYRLRLIVQELCESRGGRPGLSFLTSLTVSVDVKLYWTTLRHWS